jgi:hypothetical protein
MNIHQLQTEGSGHRLGPFTVTKSYPAKPGDSSVFILIKDDSGSAALKIWGIGAAQTPRQNETISLVTDGGPKSSITNKEYPVGSGKFSINASGCQIVREGGAESSHNPIPAAQTNEPASNSYGTNKASLEQTMQKAAEATHHYVIALQDVGFTREESIQLSVNAGSLYPLYWFGEKGVK